MEKMKEEDPAAYQWLAKIPTNHWSISHFKEIVKCDMVCNNLYEAFNRAMLDARDKPIIKMLEWIRCYLSKRMVIRREWIKKFKEELLPNCYSKLEALKDQSSNTNIYQPLTVHSHKMWTKTGHTPLLPPEGRRKFGRPKKKRIRALEEYLNPKDPTKLRKLGQNSVYCRRCGKHGHNRRTCATPLPEASGTIVQARGIGTSVQLSAKGGSVQVRGKGTSVQARGQGTSVQPTGKGTSARGRGVGVQLRGKGNGVKTRGGGVVQPIGK
ncbi:hypothetical protein RHGRI_020612 [Rhododendron griersonianum]|uniref:CCHC-type domain-containing protein n=1 Tax=Rhododendron griersonianum TaxID=479676 RepID=A0AAV6JGY0_9ERIC|nr:hypothetical protein RHGRI_020612 [Rhododendron griersonianum]